MKPEETTTVLAKCAAIDLRTVGRADVLAWHELIGHLDLPVALAAVTRWYTSHRERIMPSDLLTEAREVIRERIREAGERRHALEAEYPTDARPLTDRSAELRDFVESVRDVIPKGDPDKLRYGHRHWREIREARERAERAQPNPLYDSAALDRLAEMTEESDA